MLLLIKSLKNLVHCIPVKRCEVLQFQRLHYVEGTLLVLLEVGGLDVVLIGLFRSVDFEDSNLCVVLFHLIWEKAEHTRLLGEALLLNLCCSVEIGFEVFRIDLDFSNSDEHCAIAISDRRFF